MDYRTAKLLEAMTRHDKGDTRRIQHFVKVHDLSVTIGRLEGVSEDVMAILEAASILHDIGIHPSEKKYGNCAGPHQEELGPYEAEELFNNLNPELPEESRYSDTEIDRVKFLIGHHHTYEGIDGIDWQILVEADFLVNLYEDHSPIETVLKVRDTIFRTKAGLSLLNDMFIEQYQ